MFGCLASPDNVLQWFLSVWCARVQFFLFAVRCFEMYIDVCICNHSVERMVDGFNGPYNEQDVRLSFVVDEFDVMVQWSLHR